MASSIRRLMDLGVLAGALASALPSAALSRTVLSALSLNAPPLGCASGSTRSAHSSSRQASTSTEGGSEQLQPYTRGGMAIAPKRRDFYHYRYARSIDPVPLQLATPHAHSKPCAAAPRCHSEKRASYGDRARQPNRMISSVDASACVR